jgi:hypothetical protein
MLILFNFYISFLHCTVYEPSIDLADCFEEFAFNVGFMPYTGV